MEILMKKGSEKSLRNLNEVIYYHGREGVYRYSGGAPELISENFGLRRFQNASAGAEGYRYYLVYAGAELIGYTGVHPEEELLFLSKLYLKKQHRGHGYGRKMIEFVAGLARELGKSGVYLTVNRYNENTIAVYHATGFETVRTQVADIGNGYVMDDYVMQLAV